MKKIFILAAMCLTGIATVSAQSFSEMFGKDQKGKIGFGVRAGLNISNISGEYGPDSENKLDLDSRIGFQIGAVIDLPITNGFYLQPGLFVTTRGARKEISENDEGESYKYTNKSKFCPMYLQIPVLASFRADLSKSVNLQVNTGPHFALGLGGKYKEEWNETYEGVTESGSDDIPFFGKSKDDKEKFGAKRFDLGLSFGAGVTIKKHVYIGIQYDLGLMNMAIHDEEGGWSDKTKFHNRNFAIQLGYNF